MCLQAHSHAYCHPATVGELAKKSTVKLTAEQRTTYQTLRAEVDAQVIKEKQQLEDLSRQLRGEREKLARFDAKATEFGERRAKIVENRTTYAERKMKLETAIQQLVDDVQRAKERIAENNTERKRIEYGCVRVCLGGGLTGCFTFASQQT